MCTWLALGISKRRSFLLSAHAELLYVQHSSRAKYNLVSTTSTPTFRNSSSAASLQASKLQCVSARVQQEGEKQANYWGSVFMASTVRLGNDKHGNAVHTPLRNLLPMIHPNDIVLGGWDISSTNLADAMKNAAVLVRAASCSAT